MASDNDPVVIPMIERNPSDLPETNTSDPETLTEGTVLSFHNISYEETEQTGFPFRKKTRVIGRLSNINGIMKPGLNAIMGPQDGSRSLLLDILAARKDPCGLTGDILINGEPRPADFKCTSGYVPQDDLVMSTVTVRNNLEFSAALRLPRAVTGDEKTRRINEALELLHLEKEADVKPRSKELKKRTSIAMELVADNPILFLDDPTTGLDSETAADIMRVLRRVSMKGRTIVFSINWPPYSIFRHFDSLTLVATGKVIFHGPAQEALGYFTDAGYKYDSHNNPADFFLDIINGGFSGIFDTEEEGREADEYKELIERQYQVRKKLAHAYEQSSLYRNTRTELAQLSGEQKVERSSALQKITFATPFWHQLRWIIIRSFKSCMGFSQLTLIQSIVTALLAVAVGTTARALRNDCVEAHSRAVLLYFLMGFECMTSVFAGEIIVLHRDRCLHEHTSGYYRVSSYFFGKLLAELIPRTFLRSVIFSFTINIVGMTSVKGFFTMMPTVMLLTLSLSSLPLSLLIGAGENAAAISTLLMTIYYMSMLTFSAASLHCGRITPELLRLQYVSLPHYGITALLHNELLGQTFCTEHNLAEVSRCQDYVICTGEEYLSVRDIDISPWGFWKNQVVLACIMTLFFIIAYVQLLLQLKKLEDLRSHRKKFLQVLKEM